MLPQGSIFQYGFLGGGQFKKSLKKWTFWPKSGGLFKKNHKNWTFHITIIYIWANIFAFFKNLECNDSKQNLWTNSAEMHSHPLHFAALEIQLYDSM